MTEALVLGSEVYLFQVNLFVFPDFSKRQGWRVNFDLLPPPPPPRQPAGPGVSLDNYRSACKGADINNLLNGSFVSPL